MIDVLNLEWTSYPSRDRNVASLVCNYLRHQGINVIERSIFRGFYFIDKYKPKVLFITNATGALINFYIVKYASLKGVKVVTLTSEGNFRDDVNMLKLFVWGWNKEGILYEDITMQWSTRTRDLTLEKYPYLQNRIMVSGSCGMDIYKIKPQINKNYFLSTYKKTEFSKVVGVGCWDFSFTFPGGNYYDSSLRLFGETVLARFRKDRDSFNEILKEIVRKNQDILFILKEHPGNVEGYYMSGIEDLDKFRNTLILKKESIVDCIAVSDFWITFDSTTVFEAWALDKNTCLLNPSGIDFPRANSYLGSPNYKTKEELQNAIDAYYKIGELPGYREKREEREKAIQESIQWADGLNHVRAGNEIIRILEDKIEKKRSHIPMLLRLNKAKLYFINKLNIKRSSVYKRGKLFSTDEVERFSSSLYQDQFNFYQSLGLTKEKLRQILPL